MSRKQSTRFKLTFAALFCGAVFAYQPSYAAPVPALGEWSVKHKSLHSSAEEITSNYCIIQSDYKNGGQLVLARDYSGSMSLAYQSPKAIEPDAMAVISIDRVIERRFEPKRVNGNTLIFPLLYDYDFIDALKAGKALKLHYGNHQQSLSLRGSSKAIDRLNNCLQENSGSRHALNRSKGENSYLPTPDSIMSRTIQQNRKYRRDYYNDPSRTYIKVHFPGQNQSGPAVSAAPVASVEQTRITDYPSCHLNDPHLQFAQQKFEQKLKTKLDLLTDYKLDNLSQPVSWQQNDVKANFILTGLTPDVLKGSVFKDIETTCAGDFAVRQNGQSNWNGLSLDHYNAACYQAGGQTLMDVNFLSDGFETAILTFETAPENTEKLTRHRQSLLDSL